MAEKSYPWADGAGDGGPYTAEEWAGDVFASLFTPDQEAHAGVLKGKGGELEVTGTASPVTVATGAALVKGKLYVNDAAINVSVPTPSGDTRIDRIVLTADYSARTVRVERLEGTEGGSAPSLTQTEGTKWQIPLAQLTVHTDGTITVLDQRTFAYFGTRVAPAQIDDGAGSGLDADKLDGYDSSHYATVPVPTAQIDDGAVTPAKLASNVLPSGVIMMYSGAWNFDSTGLGTGDLEGWALCNGQNGTPDLRARFVLGAASDSELGQTGGSETQQATIPAHHHNVDIPSFYSAATHYNGSSGPQAVQKADNGYFDHNHIIDPPATDTSDVALTSDAFSIMPPYLKLAYIMKL